MPARQTNLNPRQKKALQNVYAGMSYKDAGIDAGYAKKSAEMQVCRMISKDKAKEYLSKLNEPRENKSIASFDEACEILTKIARGEMTDQTVGDQRMAAVDLVKVKYGMHVQKVEVNHKQGGVMFIPSINSVDWEKDAAKSQKELIEATIDV